MAEILVSEVSDDIAKVMQKLSLLSLQQVWLARVLESELQELWLIISSIPAVLPRLDARGRLQVHSFLPSDCLGKLKDIIQDAENVLDEFEDEAYRSQDVKREGIRSKVHNFFSLSNPLYFRLKMGHNIKEVREKLYEIMTEYPIINLERQKKCRHVVHVEWEMTHSFVRVSDVIGRDVDKEDIVSLLMHPADGENVSIIPIVGTGGVGKTTLAQLVYNDEEVAEHFDLKMWVCVPKDFDVMSLAKTIYKSATGNYDRSVDDLTIDELCIHVRSTLHNKKYLLIMDGVWNEDRFIWMELKSLLLGGANGSKIIVTTHSQAVSSIMGTILPYNLCGLSHDECLSLFVKCAFRSGEVKQHPNLLEIGDEIVKKCIGLPLAVGVLGTLLHGKTDEHEWSSVRDSELWDLPELEYSIFGALRLSYNAMPFYLKQCFAFCSIFPKGYEFTNFQLIQMWMAQGLLQSCTRNQDLEAIGQHYIEELSSRFFFQQVEGKGPFLMFKMHDLMHDLAFSVMESNSCSMHSDTSYISKRVRHLLFFENDFSIHEVSRSLLQLDYVRTISFPIEGVGPASESFVEICISRFKYLRMLNLSDSCLELLPSSIGELKHLGYLDLSHSRTLKKLPDSIYDLPNLQTLRLLGCLELEELPTGKGNFISLRSLSLTTKQMCLPEKKIGGLLRFLEIGECVNVKSLGGVMRRLTALRILAISGCESLKRLPRVMQYLTALETLHIYNCQKLDLKKWREDISRLKLSLRSISIGQLQQSTVLPPWLRAAAKTLEQIRIEDCPNLIALPEWLPSLVLLNKLEIINCPELVALPAGMQSLTELTVKIEDCPKLRRASKQETGKQFSKITFLEETSEVVEIIRSRGNFVVSKWEIDSTSKSSRSVEGSWWNLDLF